MIQLSHRGLRELPGEMDDAAERLAKGAEDLEVDLATQIARLARHNAERGSSPERRRVRSGVKVPLSRPALGFRGTDSQTSEALSALGGESSAPTSKAGAGCSPPSRKPTSYSKRRRRSTRR